MPPELVGLLIVAGVLIVGVLAVALRGRMVGRVSFLGFRMSVRARGANKTEPDEVAAIEDSSSSHGGAHASGTGGARISRTNVKKDLVAQAGSMDPKEESEKKRGT
jgi:hypothetical protein